MALPAAALQGGNLPGLQIAPPLLIYPTDVAAQSCNMPLQATFVDQADVDKVAQVFTIVNAIATPIRSLIFLEGTKLNLAEVNSMAMAFALIISFVPLPGVMELPAHFTSASPNTNLTRFFNGFLPLLIKGVADGLVMVSAPLPAEILLRLSPVIPSPSAVYFSMKPVIPLPPPPPPPPPPPAAGGGGGAIIADAGAAVVVVNPPIPKKRKKQAADAAESAASEDGSSDSPSVNPMPSRSLFGNACH